MAISVKAFFVENSEQQTSLLRELRRGGYAVECERVNTAMELSNALAQQTWDIVISEYYKSGFNGYDAVRVFKRSGADCPFVIVSATHLEQSGVAVIAAGAEDYITNDNLERLLPVVDRELRQAEIRRQWKRAN